MRRGVLLVCVIGLTVGCDDGPGPGPDPEGRVFVLEAEGAGVASAEPLLPLRSGSIFEPRRAVVRAPVEIAPGRVAHRYITQPDTLFTYATAETQQESWFSADEDGTWFEGATNGGLLESAILVVPTTVRVGMRWQTGAGPLSRTYEVLAREERTTNLGATVFWTIEQQTEPPIHRVYAEGWGIVAISTSGVPDLRGVELHSPLRAVLGETPEPTVAEGPALALQPLVDSSEASIRSSNRIDSIRAIRYGDGTGETYINLVGVRKNTILSPAVVITTTSFLYEGGVARELVDSTDQLPSGPNTRMIRPTLPGLGGSYTSGPASIFAIGNVLHQGDRVAWTTEDMLMYENELGGLSAAPMAGLYPSPNYRFELPLIAPGYGPDDGASDRPIWGTFPRIASPDRILLASGATRESVPFARIEAGIGAMWYARSESILYGRRLSDPRFVEAFPDAMGTDLTGHRGPLVSTTSSRDAQVHLFTTPGGQIDRIFVDPEGARRERIGHVELPDGHTLRAAVDVGEGALVVFTYSFEEGESSVWTASAGAPVAVAPAPFVLMEWTQWDARICWPETTEALDTSGWRLGPAPAADVLSIADNCALVVRDFEATPLPATWLDGNMPPGWGVFEGDVPGVGRVRAFEPDGGYSESMEAPTGGAWLRGGGSIDSSPTLGLEFSRGGIPRGPAVQLERGGGGATPDPSGAGMWVSAFEPPYPDPCGDPCVPEPVPNWGIALGGPNPQFFPLRAMATTVGSAVRSGGLLRQRAGLVATDHVGPVHLRPDGTFVEISPPAAYRNAEVIAVRESGEVCGTGTVDGGGGPSPVVWCAQPDGTGARDGGTPTLIGVGRGGFPMLDDDTLLAQETGPGNEPPPLLVDLETLTVRPYPGMAGSLGGVLLNPLTVGADGVVYGSFIPTGGVRTLGALTVDGFVPLQDVYDFDALFADGVTPEVPTSLLVTESFVTITGESLTVRIPRSRWNPGL